MHLSARRMLVIAVLTTIIIPVFADPPARVLEAPVLGSLVVGTDASDAKADVARLGRFFSKVHKSTSATPKCDVLFLYANVNADGTFRGVKQTLSAVIRESEAVIVVIASENPPENYLTLAASDHEGIVLVIRSNGRVPPSPNFSRPYFPQ
jgi:hypothetical protein